MPKSEQKRWFCDDICKPLYLIFKTILIKDKIDSFPRIWLQRMPCILNLHIFQKFLVFYNTKTNFKYPV